MSEMEFYKNTSPYTYLGEYKDFAVIEIPDAIHEICALQRNQIIHPVAFNDIYVREQKECFWGDMRKIPVYTLDYEDTILPTAMSMMGELLRRDKNYSSERKTENKIHVTCRGQAILLASILKAKEIPTRVRSGFAKYLSDDGKYCDHWVVEYFDEEKNKWRLVDADQYYTNNYEIKDWTDIDKTKFEYAAQVYLGLRSGIYSQNNIIYEGIDKESGFKAALRALFYDFHCIMNDEMMFGYMPMYIIDKEYNLSNEEIEEIDELAKLMLDVDRYFYKIQDIWNNNMKFRIMTGREEKIKKYKYRYM